MKIAIIAAMEEEAVEIKKHLNKISEIKINAHTFFCGEMFSKEVVLSVSGIGKVSAAILFTTLVNNFNNIQKVINIGVAGGVFGKTKTNDVVVAKNIIYHDVDVTAFTKYTFGQVPGYPAKYLGDKEVIELLKKDKVLFGTIATGDKFIVSKEEVCQVADKSVDDFILAFDMESAAFAQCAYYFKIPFTSIRSISDVIGETSIKGYDENLENACKSVTEIALDIIKKV